MQDQSLPILIFAQSGRFIAQSATQAGYRVWVADCFGDQDTLKNAERWQALDPISTLTEQQILTTFSILSHGEDCLLICGSGIECFYPVLNNLPAHIKLVGNTANTIDIIKTPTKFFSLLKQLKLNYPETQFKQPSGGDWLVKSSLGFGGHHIHYLESSKENRKHDYYQRYISGISGSALFLANGKKARLFSINQQGLHPCGSSPFRLGSITTPWINAKPHQQQLELAIHKITAETGLRGFNSVDFIISDQDQLLILEINPRISASVELLSNQLPLLQYHIDTCDGVLADILPIIGSAVSSTLSYLYADSSATIPTDMDWPEACHDIPTAGEVIVKDQPICSLIAAGKTTGSLRQQIKQARQKIICQLRGKDY